MGRRRRLGFPDFIRKREVVRILHIYTDRAEITIRHFDKEIYVDNTRRSDLIFIFKSNSLYRRSDLYIEFDIIISKHKNKSHCHHLNPLNRQRIQTFIPVPLNSDRSDACRNELMQTNLLRSLNGDSVFRKQWQIFC